MGRRRVLTGSRRWSLRGHLVAQTFTLSGERFVMSIKSADRTLLAIDHFLKLSTCLNFLHVPEESRISLPKILQPANSISHPLQMQQKSLSQTQTPAQPHP